MKLQKLKIKNLCDVSAGCVTLFTNHDVEKDILVFDGGDSNNSPIKSPDSVNRQRISISEEKFIVALVHNDPNRGLTYACLDDTCSFTRMPRVQSLSILGDRGGMILIQNALNACKRLRKSPLLRNSAKQIFCDLGHCRCICWYQNMLIPITGNRHASMHIGISTHNDTCPYWYWQSYLVMRQHPHFLVF